jgi:hypothetical protein
MDFYVLFSSNILLACFEQFYIKLSFVSYSMTENKICSFVRKLWHGLNYILILAAKEQRKAEARK